MSDWKSICRIDDIPVLGARRVARAGRADVAIFRNAEDKVFALLDRCPHKGGPLSQGIVFGESVACPLHNWTIGLADGCAKAPDEGCTQRFSVKVEDGMVHLDVDGARRAWPPAPTLARSDRGLRRHDDLRPQASQADLHSGQGSEGMEIHDLQLLLDGLRDRDRPQRERQDRHQPRPCRRRRESRQALHQGSARARAVRLAGARHECRSCGTRPTCRSSLPSWDVALDRTAAKIKEIQAKYGRDAFAVVSTGQLLTEEFYTIGKLVRGQIGTNNYDGNTTLCMASAVSGYKRSFGSDGPPGCYGDFEHTHCLMAFGSNLPEQHPIIYWRLKEALEKRKFPLIVVDPRVTMLAQFADIHLPITPGTDTVLSTRCCT